MVAVVEAVMAWLMVHLRESQGWRESEVMREWVVVIVQTMEMMTTRMDKGTRGTRTRVALVCPPLPPHIRLALCSLLLFQSRRS